MEALREKLFIVAGLGNPGVRYLNNRHNVGFNTVDVLARKLDISVRQLKFKALVGEGRIGDNRILLMKPQTYMNSSGESIRDAVEWYKIPLENLIVIYDDIDLPLGKIRVRRKGSAGTHNGMRSIVYQLISDAFPRVRVGIGRPPENMDLADFVLGDFKEDEADIIRESITRAAEAVITIINSGVDEAMARFNS